MRRRSATGSGARNCLVCLVSAHAALSCADSSTGPERRGPSDEVGLAALIVSEPTPGAIGASADPAADSDVSYVSLPPGTLADALSASIRNISTGGIVAEQVDIIEGGFDPVAVVARVGDKLEIAFRHADGARTVVVLTVPPRRPPIVVRVLPPSGRTDVSLATRPAVVFSEPVDVRSVTATSVRLVTGETPVAGRLAVEANQPWLVVFEPTTALRPATTYSLVITQDLRDTQGDALSAPVTASFTTEAPQLAPSMSQMVIGTCFEWLFHPDSTNWAAGEVCTSSGFTVIGLDGREQRLTESPGWSTDGDPDWSPDASRIAFVGHRHCGEWPPPGCHGDIYVMNADGSATTRLTSFAPERYAHGPSWSPDGTRIAFTVAGRVGEAGWEYRLYNMNQDGSGVAPIGDLQGLTPDWSPDGSRIVYAAGSGSRKEIYIAGADGSNRTRLTYPENDEPPGDTARDHSGVWSPDGSRIAFVRVWRHPAGNSHCQILVVDPDGGDPVQLTKDSFCAHSPAWSPDGALISFNGGKAGEYAWGLKVMNADGTGEVFLRRNEFGWPSRAAWRPVR